MTSFNLNYFITPNAVTVGGRASTYEFRGAQFDSYLLGQFQNKHGPKSKPLFLRLNPGHMDLMGRNQKERNIVRLTL